VSGLNWTIPNGVVAPGNVPPFKPFATGADDVASPVPMNGSTLCARPEVLVSTGPYVGRPASVEASASFVETGLAPDELLLHADTKTTEPTTMPNAMRVSMQRNSSPRSSNGANVAQPSAEGEVAYF
jgi:hypothetical protein